jgi:hypothetical protein
MFVIWFISVVVLGMLAAYQLGKAPKHLQEEVWGITMISVLLWPAVLALIIIISPFAAMLALGARAREKKESEADNA